MKQKKKLKEIYFVFVSYINDNTRKPFDHKHFNSPTEPRDDIHSTKKKKSSVKKQKILFIGVHQTFCVRGEKKNNNSIWCRRRTNTHARSHRVDGRRSYIQDMHTPMTFILNEIKSTHNSQMQYIFYGKPIQ